MEIKVLRAVLNRTKKDKIGNTKLTLELGVDKSKTESEQRRVGIRNTNTHTRLRFFIATIPTVNIRRTHTTNPNKPIANTVKIISLIEIHKFSVFRNDRVSHSCSTTAKIIDFIDINLRFLLQESRW